jgi:hypothetical protein
VLSLMPWISLIATSLASPIFGTPTFVLGGVQSVSHEADLAVYLWTDRDYSDCLGHFGDIRSLGHHLRSDDDVSEEIRVIVNLTKVSYWDAVRSMYLIASSWEKGRKATFVFEFWPINGP